MSTPAVSPTPAAPETPAVNINNTAAEISAAYHAAAAQPAPPVAPAPAPAADPNAPYTMSDLGNGQLEVKLKTGEVFKGSQQEVIAKIAEAKVNTTLHYKSELEKAKAPISQVPTTPSAPEVPDKFTPHWNKYIEDPDAAILESVSRSMQYENPQSMIQELGQILEMGREIKLKNTFSGFLDSAPDFPNSPEASQALAEAMGDAPLTTENLIRAHSVCLYQGKYKGLSPEQQAATRQNPAVNTSSTANPLPMMPPSSPAPGGELTEQQLWNMPLDELRKRAMGGR